MTGTVQAGHLIAGKYNRLYFVNKDLGRLPKQKKLNVLHLELVGTLLV